MQNRRGKGASILPRALEIMEQKTYAGNRRAKPEGQGPREKLLIVGEAIRVWKKPSEIVR
jgi:hypothetical protein